jgi:TonB-linked SusC/RagA family outer membrane protein
MKKQRRNVGWHFLVHPLSFLFFTLGSFSPLFGQIPTGFSSGYAVAQNDAARVTLSIYAENTTFASLLEEIEQKTGLVFVYSSHYLPMDRRMTLKAENQPLAKVLNTLLLPVGITYTLRNNHIILYQQRAPAREPDTEKKAGSWDGLMFKPLELSMQPVKSLAIQQLRVRGRVTTPDSEPLPGVNVVVKGTTTGTTTDMNGDYNIMVNESAVLVFSYIGYLTKEFPVRNESVLDVTLEEDLAQLKEVVVVGFGTQSKRDVTGSIASVKMEDVKNIAVASPEALLQGKAAGVQVVQNSGTPGGEVFIRVRGTASLLGESRPLFVIDGVPLNMSQAVAAGGQRTSPLADINPNDIESMEILKDAAATAIYGSRGSNGVVLITTKRGKSGKGRISFDAYKGVQNVWRNLDLLDGQQFVDVLTEGLTNRNPNLLNNAPFNNLQVTGANTNFQDEVFRPAAISNYSLSIAGGNEKMTSYVSLGYFNQEGTIIGQNFERFSFRLNLDYQATDRLKVGTSTTLSNTLQDRVNNDFSSLSVLGNALIRNPNLTTFDADGNYVIDQFRRENPVMLANEITFQGTQRRVVTNFYAEYKILKDLTFRSVAGIDYNDDRQSRYIPSFILQRNGQAQAFANFLDEQTVMNDNTLTYRKTFSEHHNLTLLAGIGFQRSTLNFMQAGGEGTGTDIVRTVGAIATPIIPSQVITGWGILSYFGRANYSYKDRYLLEGSIRVDGSSRFGANQRYGVFPGLSVGWRVSEEAFLKGAGFISDLKLRAGIGVTGNQDGIGNFASRALYGVGRNYDGNPGIGQINIPNEDLGWEATTTTNIGIDFAVLNNRFNFTAEAYVKNTSNLIFARQLPWTTGFSSIGNANIGAMENRGLEFMFTTRNLVGAFKWTTDFNISYNRVKITELPENGSAGSDFVFQLPSAFGVEGPYNIYRIGQPVGSFFGYIFDGVYARNEDVPESLFTRGIRGGDARFVDLNGDGVFDRQNDRAIVGNALPLHIGGITNTFSYKGLELSVLFNWSYGNDIYNMTRAVLTSMTDDFNQSAEVLNRWRQPGDITNVPRALYGLSSVAGNAATDASSRYIEDGSFLRMRNLTLAYNLPSSILNKVKIASARVYFSGQNLLTITNYSGLDPENQNQGTGVPILGVDYLTQPQPRVYMLGINLGI